MEGDIIIIMVFLIYSIIIMQVEKELINAGKKQHSYNYIYRYQPGQNQHQSESDRFPCDLTCLTCCCIPIVINKLSQLAPFHVAYEVQIKKSTIVQWATSYFLQQYVTIDHACRSSIELTMLPLVNQPQNICRRPSCQLLQPILMASSTKSGSSIKERKAKSKRPKSTTYATCSDFGRLILASLARKLFCCTNQEGSAKPSPPFGG